jgi:hypothetical protein
MRCLRTRTLFSLALFLPLRADVVATSHQWRGHSGQRLSSLSAGGGMLGRKSQPVQAATI